MGPCESCHAGCCRSFAVPLTGADILRIERDLGLPFWNFVCRWEDPDGRIALRYAPQFRFSDEPQTPFTICLLHQASRNFPSTTRCRFLVECPPDAEHALGRARCGIHPSRPAACRAFPAKLNASCELVVLQEVPASGRNGPPGVYDLCPRPWEPADIDALDMLQDLVVARHEMHFFHQIAQIWNRAPRAWGLFPDFLRLVYANRVVRAAPAEDVPKILPFGVSRRAA
ncbi:MAG: YkgJ family cysteine cluster protein [Planctomycetales bacterium]